MQGTFIQVSVNGIVTTVPSQRCVAELLTFLKVASERVAVELDKSIVRKRDWQTMMVGEGAEVEIVEFVGGG